jgi:hypothetical protein
VVALGLDSGKRLDPSALALLGGLAPILSLVVCRRILESVVDFRDFEIQFAQTETLHQLAIAEQLRDLDTGLHVLRVAHYCKAIAEAAGLDDKTVSLILQAAPMHDVGKICIPDAILLSPRRLTEAEFNQVKRHTLFGEQILNGQGEVISAARIIAGSHHERWDGTGYPRGLSGVAAGEKPHFFGGTRWRRGASTADREWERLKPSFVREPSSERLIVGVVWDRNDRTGLTLLARQFLQVGCVDGPDPFSEIVDEFEDGERLFRGPVGWDLERDGKH